MEAYKLTPTQAATLTGQEYKTGQVFMPFQDSQDQWYIPTIQVTECTNSTYLSLVQSLTLAIIGWRMNAEQFALMDPSIEPIYFAPNQQFNPVPDSTGIWWFIFEAEVWECTNPDYQWVKFLESAEYTFPA